MARDARVCRFCLESKQTKKNPLLDPCECKGSIQFVHEKCLLRWRYMDPARNSTHCLICLTPYILPHLPMLEFIPEGYAIVYIFLRFPMLLCFVVNYGLLIQLSIFPKVDFFTHIEIYQYFFQVVYFFLFWKMWNVRNKRVYWLYWRNSLTTVLVLTLLWSNVFLHRHQFGALVPINLVLGFFWQRHKQILQRINIEQ